MPVTRDTKLLIRYLISLKPRCLNAVKAILQQSNMFTMNLRISLNGIYSVDFDINGTSDLTDIVPWIGMGYSVTYLPSLHTRLFHADILSLD